MKIKDLIRMNKHTKVNFVVEYKGHFYHFSHIGMRFGIVNGDMQELERLEFYYSIIKTIKFYNDCECGEYCVLGV